MKRKITEFNVNFVHKKGVIFVTKYKNENSFYGNKKFIVKKLLHSWD